MMATTSSLSRKAKAVREEALQLSDTQQNYKKFNSKFRLITIFCFGFTIGIVTMLSMFYREFDSASSLRKSSLTSEIDVPPINVKASPFTDANTKTLVVKRHVVKTNYVKEPSKLKPLPKTAPRTKTPPNNSNRTASAINSKTSKKPETNSTIINPTNMNMTALLDLSNSTTEKIVPLLSKPINVTASKVNDNKTTVVPPKPVSSMKNATVLPHGKRRR
jgi:hypothetical protein